MKKNNRHIKSKLLASFFTLAFMIPFAQAQQWNYVGQPRFYSGAVYTSIALNNDSPIVAFREGSKVSCVTHDGVEWNNVGEPEFSWGTLPSPLHIDLEVQNGIPYIAYNGPNHATLAVYNGSWDYVGESPAPYFGFSEGYADFISLEFNYGIPYVAFVDEAYGNGVSLMKYDDDTWQYVGEPGFSSEAEFVSLAFHNNQPFVAYADQADDGKTTVMKYDGDSWITVGSSGFSSGDSWEQEIAINEDTGMPWVIFSDGGNQSKVSVMKFNGSSWEFVGEPGFSISSCSSPNLIFYDGIAYAAFSEQGATVMRFINNNWESVGSRRFNQGPNASTVGFDIGNNQVFVAFTENSVDGAGVSVMKYSGPIGIQPTTSRTKQVKIFPNPANEYINIECPLSSPYITVFDLLGQLKLSSQSKTLDISSLSSGVYLIKIVSEEHQVVQRFIKL